MKHRKHKKSYEKLIRKPEKLVAKLQKWCLKGKAAKLQALLQRGKRDNLVPELLHVKDTHGRSLLHLVNMGAGLAMTSICKWRVFTISFHSQELNSST